MINRGGRTTILRSLIFQRADGQGPVGNLAHPDLIGCPAALSATWSETRGVSVMLISETWNPIALNMWLATSPKSSLEPLTPGS